MVCSKNNKLWCRFRGRSPCRAATKQPLHHRVYFLVLARYPYTNPRNRGGGYHRFDKLPAQREQEHDTSKSLVRTVLLYEASLGQRKQVVTSHRRRAIDADTEPLESTARAADEGISPPSMYPVPIAAATRDRLPPPPFFFRLSNIMT